MQILPTSSDLIIDAKVSTADIAYVKKGQDATVKLDAYDYSIFGVMDGTVSYISPDILMERTVLSYLTKPIAKTLSEGMGER